MKIFNKNKKIFLLVSILLILLIFFKNHKEKRLVFEEKKISKKEISTIEEEDVKKRFVSGELNETGIPEESESDTWWLNSGGVVYIESKSIKTIQGDIDEKNHWFLAYKKNNSRDTDNGLHPQNIFRLVLRSKWKNFNEELYFKINKTNLSNSEYRNQSNGILLFNRYLDGDNLYYTGLRVDGMVVVKKKYKGEYYTMAQEVFYPGKYDRKKNPNLIPLNTWIGIKSRVETLTDGTVMIKLFVDKNRSGEWEQVIEVKDDGKKFGGKAILEEGYAGIRTDFMDVEFDDYKIEEIIEQ